MINATDNPRSAHRYVYVAQYGGLWRLPWKVWLSCATAGAAGDGYLLPSRYQIKRARGFYKVRHDADSLARDEFVPRFGVIYLEPLDWEPENFQAWLKDNAPDPPPADRPS